MSPAEERHNRQKDATLKKWEPLTTEAQQQLHSLVLEWGVMTLLGRSFLKEHDFTPDEWITFVRLAAALKAERAHLRGTRSPGIGGSTHADIGTSPTLQPQRLAGRQIALIFEKTSTRTRCAFEVAASEQGAHTTYLDPTSSQIGHKESVADTARVLGRFFDAIEFRGDHQKDVEALAVHSGVPTYNGLTDQWHPTQMLADALTLAEHCTKPFTEITHAYVGDARFNTGRSLLVSSAMLGMDVRIVAPKNFQPDTEAVEIAHAYATDTGARITITEDLDALEGADAVSTDVWVSMGEDPSVWGERIEALLPYQVNAKLMARTGNPEVKFLHCLPAFHDLETKVGRRVFEEFGLSALEVTDEVFESSASVVFDQAGNRMHTIKAVLVATLADPESWADLVRAQS